MLIIAETVGSSFALSCIDGFYLVICLFILSFVSLEDDAYVDKLPTFERNIDSFAGIVTSTPERRSWVMAGEGFETFWMVPTQSALKRSKTIVEICRYQSKT